MVLRAPLLIEMLFSRLFSEMIAHTQLFYKNNYLLYVKRGRGRTISRQGVKLQYPLKLGWYCKFQIKKEQNSISSTIKYKPSSIWKLIVCGRDWGFSSALHFNFFVVWNVFTCCNYFCSKLFKIASVMLINLYENKSEKISRNCFGS